MTGPPPHLPILPTGFGTDSSYPPIPGSTRITASQPRPSLASTPPSIQAYRPVGPPLPPLPPGALENEQRRMRVASAPHPAAYANGGLVPGQLVHAPTLPQPPPPSSSSGQFVGGFAHPSQRPTASPVRHDRPLSQMPVPSDGRVMSQAPQSHPRPPPSSLSQSQSHSNQVQAPSSQGYPHANTGVRQAAPNSPPSLSATLPDIKSLASQHSTARDEKQRLAWAKQMIRYVERNCSDGNKIVEPTLVNMIDEAIVMVSRNASLPRPDPEALYLRGDLQASGAFPTYFPKNLREAFNDFELSARTGWAPSWFRIGRDYEVLGDVARAREAYDRGIQAGDVGCVYRMGMSYLLGQLELPVNHGRAIAMLRDAADKADLDTPQPAYIYGMLLAGEFSHVDIAPSLLKPADPSTTLEAEARHRIRKAAYLNFAPAQYKCGWLYEYAQLGCAFDPLLSVQYYSLASQGGETEADMALSKWFLCGAETYFQKNESLAYTFADKAARKGLASAEFALGYYHEVGVGTERNIELARMWYLKAAAKDNQDAKERLQALQSSQASGLSRHEHEAVMEDKLVRKRTQAKMLSDREGRSPVSADQNYQYGSSPRRPSGPMTSNNFATGSNATGGSGNHLELSRKKTMKMVEETAAGRRRPKYNYASQAPHTLGSAPNQVHPMAPQPPASERIASSTHTAQPAAAAGRLGAEAGQGYPHAGAHVGSAPSSTGAASAGEDASKKTSYNTFAEMGFAPKKQKRDECVIG